MQINIGAYNNDQINEVVSMLKEIKEMHDALEQVGEGMSRAVVDHMLLKNQENVIITDPKNEL